MQFSSLFFVLGFLPVFLLCYSLPEKEEGKNAVLLVFSLLFYAFSGVTWLLLLLALCGVSFFLSRGIERKAETGGGKGLLTLHTLLLVAVLILFKYSGFLMETAGLFLGGEGEILRFALPLGISFYTFKLISYGADVYRGRCRAAESYGKLLIYAVCFHHVVQGPIVRYPETGAALKSRPFSYGMMYQGIGRFCVGLAKKVILADHCGELADLFLPVSGAAALPVAGLWVGSICFSLQMYLDFSAYSDMAIGLGQMTGFSYGENFNYPYIAVSVKDFWRRWHISLSSFFRDYVYIPLGGNRKGVFRRTLNLLAVWLLTGLWHGASWNFVLWGLFYFVFIFLENLVPGKKGEKGPAVLRFLGHLYTIFVFNLGWVLFRFEDFGELKAALSGMFGLSGQALMNRTVSLQLGNNVFFLIAAVLACLPIVPALKKRLENVCRRSGIGPGFAFGLETLAVFLLLILSVLVMSGSSYRPFLYNQF